jgi:hydrogenase maturation protein HypF
MAEHHLTGDVLGLALDGLGYGSDGSIWGGEVLRVNETQMSRLGHFRHVLLPGGDKAIKEPWRMAVSYLWSLNPEDAESAFSDFFERWPRDQSRIILQMLRQGVLSPPTSSCGRLFDAVSALAGIREKVTYEGQAAIELEQALKADEHFYRGKIELKDDLWIIDPFNMVLELIEDVRQGIEIGIISARFHNGLIELLTEAVAAISAQWDNRRVALSGGVFQNRFLLERMESKLNGRGLEVYSHIEVPTNDACIALGQAFVGAKHLTQNE